VIAPEVVVRVLREELILEAADDVLVGYVGDGGACCGRTNLNYTGSSTRVHLSGLRRASNVIILWPVG
jgi:hypothetical protein